MGSAAFPIVCQRSKREETTTKNHKYAVKCSSFIGNDSSPISVGQGIYRASTKQVRSNWASKTGGAAPPGSKADGQQVVCFRRRKKNEGLSGQLVVAGIG